MRLAQDKQMITGCIKDFSLYTCCYNPEKRKDTMSYVLHPVNISIAGSTPENAGMHIEVILYNCHIFKFILKIAIFRRFVLHK